MGAFKDLVNLFYPKCCAACGRALIQTEEAICFGCQVSLPHAHFNDVKENNIEKIFWMRADVQAATAFLRMPRHGMVHRLIHEMKYHNNPSVGKRLGKLFAIELMESERLKSFDTIIPVPLHPRRLKLRGYNQCIAIAEGMNEILNRELSVDNLVRVRYNEKQAKTRGRWDRWENVNEIFSVRFPEKLEGKRVMLVDDVITTGSTIEACALKLKEVKDLELLVGAIAYPVR